MSKIKVRKGGLGYLARIAYRNIYRNKRRSILCVAAVGLAVLLMCFMMGFIEGMLSSARDIAQTFEAGHIKITTQEYEDKADFLPLQYPIEDYEKLYETISSVEGVKHVTTRLSTYATFTSSKLKHGFISGVDFKEIERTALDRGRDKYAYYNFPKKSNGLLIGRFPAEDQNECMIGYRMARKMEIISPVLEKYEFEWILSNLDKAEDKRLFTESYKYDKEREAYDLLLFHEDNLETMSKKEFKKQQAIDRERYLAMLEIFITFEVKDIPTRIGRSAGIVETLGTIYYQAEAFNAAYSLDEATDTYVLGSISMEDREDLIYYFQKGSTMKVPLKIISSQYSDKYYQPAVTGIFEYDYVMLDENFVMVPFKKMQKLASLRDGTQTIFIFVDNLLKAPEIRRNISAKLTAYDDLVIKDWTESPFIAMFASFEIMYYIIYGIFLIVASFLIINTVIMVIHERIKEIGNMGAIGMSRSEVVIVFFLEAVALSLIGALFGTFLGGVVTGILSQTPISMEAMTGGIDFPTSSTIFVKFSPLILARGFAFGTILTAVCTIFPSLKSAFIEPVEALRR